MAFSRGVRAEAKSQVEVRRALWQLRQELFGFDAYDIDYGTSTVGDALDEILAFINRDGFNAFAENLTVASAVEETIVTYIVPAGKNARIQGYSVSGQATSRWKLKVEGVTKNLYRTSAASRGENINFLDGVIPATDGDTIIITGFHEESADQALSASIHGYLEDI